MRWSFRIFHLKRVQKFSCKKGNPFRRVTASDSLICSLSFMLDHARSNPCRAPSHLWPKAANETDSSHQNGKWKMDLLSCCLWWFLKATATNPTILALTQPLPVCFARTRCHWFAETVQLPIHSPKQCASSDGKFEIKFMKCWLCCEHHCSWNQCNHRPLEMQRSATRARQQSSSAPPRSLTSEGTCWN